MNRVYILVTALAVILTAVTAYLVGKSQAETMNSYKVDKATAEKEIRQILENYYQIAGKNDFIKLGKLSRDLSAKNYRYTNELGTFSKAEALGMFENLTPRYISAGFKNMNVQIKGNAAVVKYLDTSVIKIGNKIENRPMKFTSVWIKENGKWKVSAEHSSFLLNEEKRNEIKTFYGIR